MKIIPSTTRQASLHFSTPEEAAQFIKDGTINFVTATKGVILPQNFGNHFRIEVDRKNSSSLNVYGSYDISFLIAVLMGKKDVVLTNDKKHPLEIFLMLSSKKNNIEVILMDPFVEELCLGIILKEKPLLAVDANITLHGDSEAKQKRIASLLAVTSLQETHGAEKAHAAATKLQHCFFKKKAHQNYVKRKEITEKIHELLENKQYKTAEKLLHYLNEKAVFPLSRANYDSAEKLAAPYRDVYRGP